MHVISWQSFSSGAAEDGGSKKSSFVLDDRRSHAAYLPFGYGTRACVGQRFVIHGLATLFASMLEHYEVCLFYFLYLTACIGRSNFSLTNRVLIRARNCTLHEKNVNKGKLLNLCREDLNITKLGRSLGDYLVIDILS